MLLFQCTRPDYIEKEEEGKDGNADAREKKKGRKEDTERQRVKR